MMAAFTADTGEALTGVPKVLILAAVVIAYGSNFWPSTQICVAGLRALDLTDYHRWGIFLPHLLFYSTVMAVVSAILWLSLARAGLLPYPPLGNLRRALLPALIGGLVAVLASIVTAFAFFPPNAVHWIDPDPRKIAGNVFSNFFEEFVWRGFLLIGLREVIGFWPAAVVASASWAFLHSQYPLGGQFVIVAIGIGFAWLVRRTGSLWTPYIAHEVLDVVGDSLIG